MSHIDDDKSVTAKLRELRRARGLSVDNLAKKMGENSQKVGRVERGVTSLTLDYLVKVSKALETPLESFLEDEDKKKEIAAEQNNTNYLSQIILIADEYSQKKEIQPQKKAFLVTKAYELTLKFSDKNKSLFIESLFEFLNCLD